MPDVRPAPRPFPLRVLLVDDRSDDRALAAREIRRDHPDVAFIEAGSEEEFRTALAAASTPFDVTVVDYALGWSTGIKVFHQIRAAMPDCGVVMFTGILGQEYAVEAMKAGLDDCVAKDPRRYPRRRASVTAILQQREERQALRRAEADCDILLKEVFHRAHSSLQAVMALLRMHAGRVTDEGARRLLEDLGGRIHALALVQGRLYRGDDYRTVEFDEYLREPAAAHARLADRPEVAIEVGSEPIRLPVDLAVPLGLIANELLSNALKHAFPNGRAGHIVLSLAPDADGAVVVLAVGDDGAGMHAGAGDGRVAERQGGGIGSQLVRGLARQIGAEFTLGSGSGGAGTAGRVRVPLGSHGRPL
jgi:two-component sensor histidine kinase